MRSKLLRSVALFALLAAIPVWSVAQRTDATFAGIVNDPSGAVLPGADIELINEGTAAVMRQVTNETGEFVFNFVPVGTYTLKIGMPGFKSYESRAIPLGAAQNVRRTYTLEVGSTSESVMVTGEAPLVNTLSPEQRMSLDQLEVSTLPTFNRNVFNLLDVGTGVVKSEIDVGGNRGGDRLRLNGLGGSAMSITADGTNANMNGGAAATISGYGGYNKIDIMSQESVSEVQVVKGVFSAEYGSAMGGNLSMISKSGTNEWHGSLFHRYEGSVLSARAPLLAQEPNSVWNQYGGSIGGPIMRDKAFFFVAFEGYRMSTSTVVVNNVPTPMFRDIIQRGLPGKETEIRLRYYPLPNQPYSSTDLLARWIGPAPQKNSDDHVDFKVDYMGFGGNLSLSASLGHPYQSRAAGLPTNPEIHEAVNQRASLNYVMGRARWTLNTRIGFNRNYEPRDALYGREVAPRPERDPGNPYRQAGWLQIPTFSYPGMSALGGRVQHRGLVPGYSVEQQFAVFQGKHSWKFGGLWNIRSGGKQTIDPQSVSFQTLADIQNNTPSQVGFAPAINAYKFRVHDIGFFVQDDWRVSQKLVLNLGLRYEYYNRIWVQPWKDPDYGVCICNRGPLLDADRMIFGPALPPNQPSRNDPLSLGPRFGFAYTMDDQGDFVMRGGFGIGFQGLDKQSFTTRAASPSLPSARTWTRAEAARLGFRYPMYRDDLTEQIIRETAAAGAPLIGDRFNTNFSPPYAMNYTLGFQKALTKTSSAEIAYVGTRGVKFTMNRNYNEPDRVTGIRPNPNDINGIYTDDSQQTNYNSLQLSFRQRMTKGLQFNSNYTWGKAMGYGGGDIGQGFNGDSYGGIEDFHEVKIARGANAGDIEHSFVTSAVYDVPTPFQNAAISRYLLGGWGLSGIFRINSGEPLNVSQTGGRPDLLDWDNAVNKGCCSFGNLQYLNPAAFRTVPVSQASGRTIRRGHIGNAALRGPGMWNIDLSLNRDFRFMEGKRLELRADLTNALNHTQYIRVQTNMNTTRFGEVNATRPPRKVQVQLRLAF